MNINDYSARALTTILSQHDTKELSAALLSQVFGLAGESGEVAGKFSKLIRDKHGKLSDEDTVEIIKELGDVLWYVNSIADLLGSSLEQVAQANLDKVLSRKERGVVSGSGDNR